MPWKWNVEAVLSSHTGKQKSRFVGILSLSLKIISCIFNEFTRVDLGNVRSYPPSEVSLRHLTVIGVYMFVRAQTYSPVLLLYDLCLYRDSLICCVLRASAAHIFLTQARYRNSARVSMGKWRLTPVNPIVFSGSYDDSVGEGSCTGEEGIVLC